MNLAEMFAPLPTSADEAWARLHAFAAEWWRAPGVKDGLPSSQLDRAEKRLRITLPSAVRNMYCFFGRYPELTRGQINLVRPEDLGFRDDVLVLFLDEHAVAVWGVKRSDLSAADPPIVMRLRKDSAGREPPWVAVSPRFTTFFTESALLQATESARYINWMETAEPVAMPGELVCISTGAAVRAMREATLYVGEDILVALDSPPSLFAVSVAAPTEQLYQKAIALFPGAKWRQHADSVHQPNYAALLADLDLIMRMLKAEARKKR